MGNFAKPSLNLCSVCLQRPSSTSKKDWNGLGINLVNMVPVDYHTLAHAYCKSIECSRGCVPLWSISDFIKISKISAWHFRISKIWPTPLLELSWAPFCATTELLLYLCKTYHITFSHVFGPDEYPVRGTNLSIYIDRPSSASFHSFPSSLNTTLAQQELYLPSN